MPSGSTVGRHTRRSCTAAACRCAASSSSHSISARWTSARSWPGVRSGAVGSTRSWTSRATGMATRASPSTTTRALASSISPRRRASPVSASWRSNAHAIRTIDSPRCLETRSLSASSSPAMPSSRCRGETLAAAGQMGFIDGRVARTATASSCRARTQDATRSHAATSSTTASSSSGSGATASRAPTRSGPGARRSRPANHEFSVDGAFDGTDPDRATGDHGARDNEAGPPDREESLSNMCSTLASAADTNADRCGQGGSFGTGIDCGWLAGSRTRHRRLPCAPAGGSCARQQAANRRRTGGEQAPGRHDPPRFPNPTSRSPHLA